MKNRIASLFLAFVMLMSLCVSAGAADHRITVQSGGAERFTDVPTSHWAYGYINKVVGSGLFNGRTPTTFEPSSAMTRSQFVMVMARMEGHSDLEGVETVTQFPDVTATRRAAGPIKWATDEGIVQGFGDGTFKPDSPITRGQFAALIHRYIIAKRYTDLNVLDPEPAQFTDAASVTSAFKEDVEYARVHGLLTGYSDGTVRAGNPITRAAIAAILARFLDLVTESGYTPFLDGPDDSGQTDTPPVDAPTSYDEIKLKVSGESHGSVPTVSITRDGATVAKDDVQTGDRVTIRYQADKGYVAKVRARDANGKVVTVKKIDATSSWFTMPAATPVTVTVTYSKESSGGGGGGSTGGGSDNYTPSGGDTPAPSDDNYYWTVSAIASSKGTVKFSQSEVTAANIAGLTKDSLTKDDTKSASSPLTFYAVLTPNDASYTVACSVDTENATLKAGYPQAVSGSTVYAYEAANATKGSTVDVVLRPSFTDPTNSDDSDVYEVVFEHAWAKGLEEEYGIDDSPEQDAAKLELALPTSGDIAKATESMTVTAPYTDDGYFKYDIVGVKYDYTDTNGEPKSLMEKNASKTNDNNWTKEYAFNNLPYAKSGSKVTVTAYYSANKNENLDYKFTVKFDGDGDGKISFTPSGGAAKAVMKSDAQKSFTAEELGLPTDMKSYIAAYEGKDFYDTTTWKIPFTVDTPVQGENSEYDNDAGVTVEVNDTKQTADKNGKYYLTKAENKAEATISATFNKVEFYGFKMTVIGYGDVTGIKFNGTKFDDVHSKDDGKLVVRSSGGLVKVKKTDSNEKITVEFTAKAADDWKVNAEASPVTLTEGEVKNIAIVFRNQKALPVLFTVDVDKGGEDGTVKVSAENGAIMTVEDAGSDSLSTLKGKLQNNDITSEGIEVTKTSADKKKQFYALSGTIITLNAADSDTVKVKTITLNGKSADSNKGDILDKAGYSFKLASPASEAQAENVAQATVTFGKFDSYALTLSAPVKTDWSEASLYAKSTKIGTNATIEQVLAALNNKRGTTDESKIENNYAGTAESNLAAFVTAFLESESSEIDENGKALTVVENLEKQLESAAADIGQNIPQIINAEKEKALGSVDLEKTVKDSLPDDETITETFTLNSEDAGGIIGTVMRDLFKKHPNLESEYNANPAAFTVQVTSLKARVNEDATKQDGNSVKEQLVKMLTAYTGKLTVKDDFTVTPAIHVELVQDENDANKTQIVISANAELSKLPELADVEFAQYADTLNLYADVKAKVLNNGTEVAGYAYDGVIPFSEFDATLTKAGKADKTADKVVSNIKAELQGDDGVDKAVKAEWEKAFPTTGNSSILTRNGSKLYISADMSQLPISEILEKVVRETMLKDALERIGKSVLSIRNYSSAGEYLDEDKNSAHYGEYYDLPQTKAAFMNLYNDFIVVNDGESAKLIELKTPNGTKTLGTIGSYNEDGKPIDENGKALTVGTDGKLSKEDAEKQARKGNIVVSLNMLNLMFDETASNDTSFEKLMSLLVAFRDGVKADIQNAGGKTAQSVFADMILGRIGNARGGKMTVVKWGEEISPVKLNSVEANELSELLAALMLSDTSDTFDAAWSAFEEHGYRSVTFSAGVANKQFTGSMVKLGNTLENNKISVGFKAEQIVK